MDIETKVLIGGFTAIVGIVLLVIITGLHANKVADQQARDNYYQCLEKTSDIQWCFIKFKPDIK